MDDAISEQIIELISEEVGMEPEEISHDTPLLSSGLVDSFSFVTILSIIEETTELTLDPSELTLENFDNLNAIKSFVSERTTMAE